MQRLEPRLPQPARAAVAGVSAQAGRPVEWVVEEGLLPYREAVAAMEARATAIAAGEAAELVWLVEHPPLYTAGTSAKDKDLIAPDRLPVFRTGRGGEFTYHGPGQRVVYLMLDLNKRGPDFAATLARSKTGSSRRLRSSTWSVSGAKIGSASGCAGPTGRRLPTDDPRRTRSPPSAFVCAAG